MGQIDKHKFPSPKSMPAAKRVARGLSHIGFCAVLRFPVEIILVASSVEDLIRVWDRLSSQKLDPSGIQAVTIFQQSDTEPA